MRKQMLTIFVTGGTGFIGKEVVRVLASQYNLIVLSRTARPSTKNVTYITGDLLDKKKPTFCRAGRYCAPHGCFYLR